MADVAFANATQAFMEMFSVFLKKNNKFGSSKFWGKKKFLARGAPWASLGLKQFWVRKNIVMNLNNGQVCVNESWDQALIWSFSETILSFAITKNTYRNQFFHMIFNYKI